MNTDTNVYIVLSTRMMKESVICLVNELFLVIIGLYLYTQIAKRRIRPLFAFNMHANTRSSRMFGRVCTLKANTGLVCLFAICTI